MELLSKKEAIEQMLEMAKETNYKNKLPRLPKSKTGMVGYKKRVNNWLRGLNHHMENNF